MGNLILCFKEQQSELIRKKKKTKSRTRVLNCEFHDVGTVIDFNGDGVIIIRIVQHPNQAVNIHIHDDVAVATVVHKPPRSEGKVDD